MQGHLDHVIQKQITQCSTTSQLARLVRAKAGSLSPTTTTCALMQLAGLAPHRSHRPLNSDTSAGSESDASTGQVAKAGRGMLQRSEEAVGLGTELAQELLQLLERDLSQLQAWHVSTTIRFCDGRWLIDRNNSMGPWEECSVGGQACCFGVDTTLAAGWSGVLGTCRFIIIVEIVSELALDIQAISLSCSPQLMKGECLGVSHVGSLLTGALQATLCKRCCASIAVWGMTVCFRMAVSCTLQEAWDGLTILHDCQSTGIWNAMESKRMCKLCIWEIGRCSAELQGFLSGSTIPLRCWWLTSGRIVFLCVVELRFHVSIEEIVYPQHLLQAIQVQCAPCSCCNLHAFCHHMCYHAP